VGVLRSSLLRLGYKASALLDVIGLRRFALVRNVQHAIRQALTRDQDLVVHVHGIRLSIPTNTASPHEYLDRPFEPFTTELVRQAVHPGAQVLDIGAQFGFFTLLAAARAGAAGHVHAFEPVPSNFRLLERNVALSGLGNITPVPKAVGSRPGSVPIFVYQSSDSHSLYQHPEQEVRAVIDVDCVAIDDYLAGRRVDVVKMDIEGHEPVALEGMQRTIAQSPRLVLFTELAPAYLRRGGHEPERYVEQLERLGFFVRLIEEESRELLDVTPAMLARAAAEPDWHRNLYCTRA
jgi:FkbM family methyltransferase